MHNWIQLNFDKVKYDDVENVIALVDHYFFSSVLEL